MGKTKAENMQSRKLQSESGYPLPLVATNHADVTPHDTNSINGTNGAGLFVGVGGDLKIQLIGATGFCTYKNIPDGSFLPVLVDVVHTDTTATDIIAIWDE